MDVRFAQISVECTSLGCLPNCSLGPLLASPPSPATGRAGPSALCDVYLSTCLTKPEGSCDCVASWLSCLGGAERLTPAAYDDLVSLCVQVQKHRRAHEIAALPLGCAIFWRTQHEGLYLML